MQNFINSLKLCTQRQLIVTLFLGFSSGLPIALCGSTLQAWFAVSGMGIATIGALTLVGQPYIYKFLWAPLLDRYIPPLLGRRTGWILLMQLALAITLAAMGVLNPVDHPGLIGLLALFIAIFSATQDIGIDAYRADLLRPDERGLGAAMVAIGYRFAMIVSGGMALILAAQIGWRDTYFVMAVLMAAGTIVTWFSPEPQYKNIALPHSLKEVFIEPIKNFLTRKSAISIFIFIVIYKLSDAMTLSLGTTFLLRGLGFSLASVGAIYKLVGIFSTLLGAFCGGLLMVRFKMLRSLFYFGILQGVSNWLFMLLAMVGKNYFFMVIAVFGENFCGGLSTVAFIAFLMSLCDARYTATQFAVLSALSAIGRVFIGPVAAFLMLHMTWAQFYFWSGVIVLPSLVLLWFLRDNVKAIEILPATENAS